MSDDGDARQVYEPGPIVTDPEDLLALVRRYERSAVDTDQRLKDIVMLLRDMRDDLRTERDRTDQLERDFVEHRKALDEMAARRTKATRRK